MGLWKESMYEVVESLLMPVANMVLDSVPCGKGCHHVIPRLEYLRVLVEAQKCAGLWLLGDQDGDWPEVALHHIQWRARRKARALPNS